MKQLAQSFGSNSFKFRVLDTTDATFLARGRVERGGHAVIDCTGYPAAVHKCICQTVGSVRVLASLAGIEAVGFKAVHIGPLNERQLIGDAFQGGRPRPRTDHYGARDRPSSCVRDPRRKIWWVARSETTQDRL